MMLAGNASVWRERVARATLTIIDRTGHLLLDESAAARSAVAQYMIESND